MNQAEIIAETSGALGVITLNRPQVLNALSLEMLRQISTALHAWEKDEAVRAVYFIGAGERAFCAGGDIKAFYRAGMACRRGEIGLNVASLYFRDEYALDRQIFHYPKPTIAFMNGITMGGGFGIAVNCKHRIACEHTQMAMPEVGIGFFPDVGSAYHLTRMKESAGIYMGLTGNTINPADILQAGLADYYIPRGDEVRLQESLSRGEEIEKVLERFSKTPTEESVFKAQAQRIEDIFGRGKVSGILNALAQDGSDWAAETMGIMRGRSPTSLLVTEDHLRRARGESYDAVIQRDFTLAQRFMERHDLYEGIRAAVIDKDRQPRWEPDRLEKVEESEVAAHFEETGNPLVVLFEIPPPALREGG